MDCLCEKDRSFTSLYPRDEYSLPITGEYTTVLDFGQVAVGTTAQKVLRVKNHLKKVTKYYVKRDPDTNPIYHMFDMNPYEAEVEPDGYLDCCVTYAPAIPQQRDLDNFEIVDNCNNVYMICTKGECTGATVHVSTTTLYFYTSEKGTKSKNTFEMQNMSDTYPVIYQFDVNASYQGIFSVNKVYGTIQPSKHAYIEVTFLPLKPGCYRQRLCCLILHSRPIIIELVGIYTLSGRVDPTKTDLSKFAWPAESAGFEGYLSDSLTIRKELPPVSFSENYIDFGRVLPNDYNEKCKSANCLTLVTCLTNHLETEVFVSWERDEENVFHITPETATIPTKESLLYECHFYPNFKDQVYSKTLNAQVSWPSESRSRSSSSSYAIELPLVISLRLIGHSFPENTGWIPRAEIVPDKIILPACMPTYPSATTFLLKSKGHLPVLFKFLPPRKSNYIIKPMVGIIRDYQIIAVQMQAETNQNAAYIEHWQLELNGQRERVLPLYIKGQAEWPSITVGHRNVVRFGYIHPGCQDILQVPMRNNTSYPLMYRFILDNMPFLDIDEPGGEIQANEIKFFTWYFLGSLKGPSSVTLKCEIHGMQKMRATIGPPCELLVQVHAECRYTELCATPREYDFGKLLYGERKMTTFMLFNFGEAPLHIWLFHDYDGKESTAVIELKPRKETINSREMCQFKIYVRPAALGYHEVKFHYKLRLNRDSDEIINEGEKIEVFTLRYRCEIPTVQIKEISYHTYGPLFSKVNLWEILGIDKFNKTLVSIQHGETRKVDIMLPEYMLDERESFKIVMALKNESSFPEKFALERQKICDCKKVEVSAGISLRKKVFVCPHRSMLEIRTGSSDTNIPVGTVQNLTFEVKYIHPPGLSKLLYIINMSLDRRIEMVVHLKSLTLEAELPSIYTPAYELDMGNMYIGERDPQTHVFWFYNSLSKVLRYFVDMRTLEEVNDDCRLPLINCTNPTGLILAHSAAAIVFRLQPCAERIYEINVPIKFDEGLITLILKANGTCKPPEVKRKVAVTQKTSQYFLHEQKAVLSVDHLIIHPILTWSTTDRLICIANRTKNEIGYWWKTVVIHDVLEAEVVESEGILAPAGVQACLIKIMTMDTPCKTRFNLVCEFLDLTENMQHEQSAEAYRIKNEEIKDVFTITEKGFTQPVNDVEIYPKPKPFYAAISIEVNVYSTPDRDMHLDIEQQIEQKPQLELRPNSSNVLFKEHRLNDIEALHMKLLKNLENVANAAECCLADTLFSSLYRNTLDTMAKNPPPYYIQIKPDVEEPKCFRLDRRRIAKTTENMKIRRTKLSESFLQQPKHCTLTEIFQHLINESVSAVFRLPMEQDTRVKDRLQRSKFT